MATIKFGTSGWREIIARDFTFDNVRLATQGIADYLKSEIGNPKSEISRRKPVVIVGHDTRFLARNFPSRPAEVLAANGIEPLLCDRDTPTPVIAYAIRHRKAIGGINMTASHNPAEYQGLKFSTFNGAPATPDVTKQIEANIVKLQRRTGRSTARSSGRLNAKHSIRSPPISNSFTSCSNFPSSKRRSSKSPWISVTARRTGISTCCSKVSARKVTLFHNELNPLFGGHHPEPNAENMADVSKFVRSGKAQIGLGTDGDADRFGIVDKDGTWLTPNQVLALALYHLKKNRGWTGAVVRTVPTSHQVDAVAKLFGVNVYETPVGFKYIGALMESEPIIVGGEESGGLSVKGHVPEKDGILACLLMAELVATEKKSLGQILKELAKQIGEFYTDRINISFSPEKKEALLAKLGGGLQNIGAFKVEKFITTDGFKFLLPGERMGGVPRQRHRAADPLLHRSQDQGEFEEARRGMREIARA
jgi:phosphoglucomutase